jgi:MFS family permease
MRSGSATEEPPNFWTTIGTFRLCAKLSRMTEAPATAPKLTTWQSFRAVAKSWRLASVTLLMFSSSLPLGLVWIAIPAWMARIGVDIKVVGLFTLAQAPWSFKFLWSPFVDRYPLPFLGRKRGYVFVAQIALFALGLGLAGAATHPDAIWVIGALALATAFASATQDIAYDAYAVEVLREEEYGVAAGARGVLGRSGLWVGGIAITLAGGGTVFGVLIPALGWPLVNLAIALLYLPMLIVTWRAPEPEAQAPAPTSLRAAVWEPFVGFLAQHRAIEILAFVVFFKFSDNLTQALLRPFFVQAGYNDVDVGFASMTVGTVAISMECSWAACSRVRSGWAGPSGSSDSSRSSRTWATRSWPRCRRVRCSMPRRPSRWGRAVSARARSWCSSCASPRSGSPRHSTPSCRASCRSRACSRGPRQGFWPMRSAGATSSS